MKKKAIILGAGPSGLAAAWQLAQTGLYEIDVYDKAPRIGGVCGYFDLNGMRLDLGPHKIYSVIPGIMDAFKGLGKERLVSLEKHQRLIIRGRLIDYPVKISALLPLFSAAEIFELCCSILITILKQPFLKPARTYEQYCINIFGKKAYQVIFKPLAQKVWADPAILSADIARTRIPTKSIFDLLLRAAGLRKETQDTDAKTMLYPAKGFYDICECMAEKLCGLSGRIHLNRWAQSLVLENKTVREFVLNDNTHVKADLLISTIPVRELDRLLYTRENEQETEKDLIKMRHCIVVYLLINRPKVLQDHWLFCPDDNMIFSRISEQKLFSEAGLPRDNTVISCDFTCDGDSDMWKMPDSEIAYKCIDGLKQLRLISIDEVIEHKVARIPEFYPVFDLDYKQRLERQIDKINAFDNIISTGRLGLCSYNNIDHCLDMALYLRKGLENCISTQDINKGLLAKAGSYRIVD